MKFLLPLFLCSSLFAQNITNLYVGQQLSVGMQLTTVPSAGSSYTNVVNGIVGWWKFDEGTGLVALDSSGNLNVGTINGGSSYVTGKVGPYALSFDGSSGYVDVPNNSSYKLNGLSSMSVSYWLKLSNSNPSNTVWGLIGDSIDGDPTTYGGWQMYFDNRTSETCGGSNTKRIQIDIGTAGAANYASSYVDGSITNTNWHHIVATYDGTQSGKIYIDGVNNVTSPGSCKNIIGAIRDSTNNFVIGSLEGGILPVNGSLDDVRIYNRALSAGEVLDLYNFTK